MGKLKNIEFLRIIFLFSVIFMHITQSLAKNVDIGYIKFLAYATSNGGKAVDAFFILSGFFLIYTFKNSTTVLDFVKKKIIRLLPVIFFAIILCLIGAIFHVTKFEFSSAIISLTFTQMITFADKIVNWNHIAVTWYVSVMFWICLLYFYLLKCLDKKIVNLIIGVVTICSYYIAFHIHNGSLCQPNIVVSIFNLGFLRGFGGIGIGYFIGEWYKNRAASTNTTQKEKVYYTILELAFLVISSLELIILNTSHKYNICIIIYLTILILLFLINKGYISQFFNKDWCVICGRYSYSIYVLHLLIYQIMKNTNILIPFGKFCLIPAILIPVLAGIATYHLVEKPSARYLKKILFKESVNNG